MMNLYQSWLLWQSNLPTNVDGDKNMESFFTTFQGDQTWDNKIHQITQCREYAFIIHTNTGEITLCHNPCDVGGTRFRPEHKLLALVGSGHIVTTCIIDTLSATDDCHFAAPSDEDLLNATTADEISLLSPCINNFLDGTHTMMVPPFITLAFMSLKSKDPATLYLGAISAAATFDTTNSGNQEFNDIKAAELITPQSKYIWGVISGKMKTVDLTFAPDDPEAEKYTNERHTYCISFNQQTPALPPANTQRTTLNDPAILELIADGIARSAENAERNAEINEQQLTRQTERDKKDISKKFHASTVNMLRMAACTPTDEVAPAMATGAKSIFACDCPGTADTDYRRQFASLGIKDAGYSKGPIKALYNGHFLYHDHDSPCNFSIFAHYEIEPLAEEESHSIITQMAAREGKAKTEEQLKVSLKQNVTLVTTVHEMMKQLLIFATACSIWFGENSALAISARSLHDEVNRHSIFFRLEACSKPDFIVRFLYKADSRFQRYLDCCHDADDPNTLPRSDLNFKDLVRLVVDNSFIGDLPSTFNYMSKSPAHKPLHEQTRGILIRCPTKSCPIHLPEYCLRGIELMRTFIVAARNGIDLNFLAYLAPTRIYSSDSCPYGMGRYNNIGRAWRWVLPRELRFRGSNNMLEHMASVIGPWIDIIENSICSGDCILSMTDLTTSEGWSRKTSFRETGENDVQAAARIARPA